jgi:ferrous iron transport protein B
MTLPPVSEDEQITARVLLEEPLRGVVQVGDTKNLRRTLFLTLQLAEMGIPMALALNMMDEAETRGLRVNQAEISAAFSIPVVPMIATRGQGVDELVAAIVSSSRPAFQLIYPEQIERAVQQIGDLLSASPVDRRGVAMGWLSGDPAVEDWLSGRLEAGRLSELRVIREVLQGRFSEPLVNVIQRERQDYVDRLASVALAKPVEPWHGLAAMLGGLAVHPWYGLPILAGVLYALYWFVGVFGAGRMVGWLEGAVFGQVINPWVSSMVYRLVPFPLITDFLVGEYGLWTVGMTYAIALLLPIVTTFFFAFGVLEDSGYLPRLAVLTNRHFSSLGLNGKAVLPMVLGLGCVTMATLTTRTLETKRERLLVTLLLALAVPCSAQLGVVMAMLAGISFGATLVWLGVVLAILLVVGWLAARLVPGERQALFVELPPMRLPVLSNVMVKTLARLEWYLKEVVPIFLLGTALLFVLDQLGLLDRIIRASEPLIRGWLGLPPQASAAFLVGFLRRDFAATGLFVMQTQGQLSPIQAVVAMVTITLFIPCIASVMVIAKERGWKTAVGMAAFIFPLAFVIGGLVNQLLLVTGWAG